MNFSDRLSEKVREKKSCLFLSLDPEKQRMPKYFQKQAIRLLENGEPFVAVWAQMYAEFCLRMMVMCEEYIVGVKIQMAYFEVLGSHGMLAVEHLARSAREKGLIVLIDGKRNDIGSTAEAYAEAYLEEGPLAGDALTISPFLGTESVTPFLKRCETLGRGIFVLLRTSNPSSEEFQPLLQGVLSEKISEWGKSTLGKNRFSSVGAVVGATQKKALQEFRKSLPHAWFLCPGVGPQGGSLEDALSARVGDLGILLPIGRAVLYASEGEDFMEKGREVMRDLWEKQK